MVVSVHFCGVQRAHTKARQIEVPVIKDGRVSDVFLYLKESYPNLPLDEKDLLVTVNNHVSSMKHSLNPHDKIVFLPHIGGG